jgi:2'-5' RNA ligase
MMEEKIINRLKVAAMGTPPFKVVMKDYGSFPSHTIFINVTTRLPIQQLIKEVRQAQRLMKSPDHDPFFISDPYIAIARKLTPAQYETSWREYAHRSFTGSFIADAMLLLKRREGQRGHQILERFEFMNLPVVTKQGELFM